MTTVAKCPRSVVRVVHEGWPDMLKGCDACLGSGLKITLFWGKPGLHEWALQDGMRVPPRGSSPPAEVP